MMRIQLNYSFATSSYFHYVLLLLSFHLFSFTSSSTCKPSNFPRECQCQPTRHTPIFSSNETYLRCRQLTDITTKYPWSNVTYDRLIFETFHENLTVHSRAFAGITARTLRFNTQNFFLNSHSFENASIGQFILFHQNLRGRIHFQANAQIFYGLVTTDLYFKSIDFQAPIPELVFSNSTSKTFTIHSCKFYGFTEQNYNSTNLTSFSVTTFAIVSSINTTNLTENYLPIDLAYEHLEEIELSFNEIHSLDAHVFRHLRRFQGRLLLLNNQIQQLHPQALVDLVSLRNLSLANNFIEDFSSVHLTQLYELDLSSNLLVRVTKTTFEYLQNLRVLYLNFNPLEVIEADAFSSLTHLQQIHFRGVHLLSQQSIPWIWNLASLHHIHSIRTDFDLSDVAFCILSRYNRTLSHLSRQDACSCRIHYFNRNERGEQSSEHLRLTPLCSETILEQNRSVNELVIRNLEGQCHYQLMYLNCEAMMRMTTPISEIFTQTLSPTPSVTPPVQSKGPPVNNIKKLFTVLATLAAITIAAIVFVFFWYRFKAMLKRRGQKRKYLQRQQHFAPPASHTPQSAVPRHTSVDIVGSLNSAYLLSTNRNQVEPLLESPPPPPFSSSDIDRSADSFGKLT